MEQWDPIHVKDSPEAADEYDGYRGAVVHLLCEGVPAERIADYLSQVEQTRMGFNTTPQQLLPVAELLVRWYPDLARQMGGISPEPESATGMSETQK